MNQPARNTLAIIGAGPIGLEAAAGALELGFDVHVFERGEVGAHPLAWGHVRMFTPWRMNIGPASARLLASQGWIAPAAEELPTGAELTAKLLQPLARTSQLAPRVHEHSQVVHLSRRGALKGDLLADPARSERPFRLLVRDAGGHESLLHACSVIDASGTYGQPNWAGTGGIPARGEIHLAPQMSYAVDDVRGLRRERHAGKRTLVIGGGASAITTVRELEQLATEVGGTSVVWVTRRAATIDAPAEDPLPERARLRAEGRRLQSGTVAHVSWVGGAELDSLEYNSATHRYRAQLLVDGVARSEEADQVIVNCGFGPDNDIFRELQVHECYATRAPMKLSAALLGAGTTDCVAMPVFGVEQLLQEEPDFYLLGSKAYGRHSGFLLETGYRQVADILSHLARRQLATAVG